MEKIKRGLGSLKNDFKGITPKDAILSFQHMFAMLGATVLVPILANLSISIALLAAGIGTIFFYFCTKRKVPVFLGSSFAFLPGLMAIVTQSEKFTKLWNQQVLAAGLAIFLAGLVYVALAIVIKFIGVQKIKRLFPPIVVGPVIIIIGMILAPKMFFNNIIAPYHLYGSVAWKEWTTALITALTIVGINVFAKPKSFLKVIPILLGFVVGYIYGACIGLVSFKDFNWTDIIIFQHIDKELGFYGAFAYMDWQLFGSAALMIIPLALVTFMEHLGDVSANSIICGKDFMVDPGLHRTVLGDGVATMIAGALGGPANTTYGENTAVLAITKNYNPRNIFFAACLAVLFGMFSIFGNILATIPASVIGGASIVLFGMISASGLRALVDAKVDFSITKNLTVVSVVLSIGLGLGAMSMAGDILGSMGIDGNAYKIMIGSIEISPLAIATVIGVVLNLVIPEQKDETPVGYADPRYEKQENAQKQIVEHEAESGLEKLLDSVNSEQADKTFSEEGAKGE